MNNQTEILVKAIAKEMQRLNHGLDTPPPAFTLAINALAEMDFADMLQAYYELKTT